MRVGTLRLRRRWIDPDSVLRGQIFLTAFSALMLLLAGFTLGWVAGRWSSGTMSSSLLEEYGGYGGHITTSSWVENVAFGSGGSGRDGGCECNTYENMKLALDSLSNSSSTMYY